MTTLVTGAGLIGAAFARHALKRGEKIVFFDPEPREAFLRFKLGEGNYELARKDVRDLPALIEAMQQHKDAGKGYGNPPGGPMKDNPHKGGDAAHPARQRR